MVLRKETFTEAEGRDALIDMPWEEWKELVGGGKPVVDDEAENLVEWEVVMATDGCYYYTKDQDASIIIGNQEEIKLMLYKILKKLQEK